MGTRSYIAKQIGADSYRSIYSQLDGYPSYLGLLLIDYYNTEEMVDKLLDLGDIYVLKPKLEPDTKLPHDWITQQKDVTVAFGRDMEEPGFDSTIKTLADLNKNFEIEYVYIFTQENEWKYFTVGELNQGLLDLKETVDYIKSQNEASDNSYDEFDDDINEIGGIMY